MWQKLTDIVFKVRETAKKVDLHYAVCIWKGPFGELNHRVGYFEQYTEAIIFCKMLQETYEKDKFQLPYRIYSSVHDLNNVGNLCV